MKKISKLSLGIIAPIVTMSTLIPLTSCGDYGNYIDPQIRYGDHVYGAEHTNITLYDSFTIRLTSVLAGYEQFDTSKTTITIGGTKVKYTLTDPTTIVVPADVVTSSDISIYLEAKETCQDFKVAWTEEAKAKYNYMFGNLQFHVANDGKPADTIVGSDLLIQTLWGDSDPDVKENWRTVDINDPNLYIFILNNKEKRWVNITSSFKQNGYTFSEDDLYVPPGLSKPSQIKFGFKYKTTTFEKDIINKANGDIWYHITKIELSQSVERKVKCEDALSLSADITPAFASLHYKFVIIDDGGTGSVISGRKNLVAGKKTGTVKVQGYSLDDPTVETGVYDIEVVQE